MTRLIHTCVKTIHIRDKMIHIFDKTIHIRDKASDKAIDICDNTHSYVTRPVSSLSHDDRPFLLFLATAGPFGSYSCQDALICDTTHSFRTCLLAVAISAEMATVFLKANATHTLFLGQTQHTVLTQCSRANKTHCA